MLRQRLPAEQPRGDSRPPTAWVIRGEHPHALLGLLGLGTGGYSLPGTSLLDLGGLGAEVEDQRDQGGHVAGELSTSPSGVCTLTGNWRAASFSIASTPSATPPLPRWIGMTISWSPAGPVTSRTRRSSVRRSFMSCSRWAKKPLRVAPARSGPGSGCRRTIRAGGRAPRWGCRR